MNYWYAPRPNELFLDLDSKAALTRTMRVLHVWMDAQRMAKGAWGLPSVRQIYNYPTTRKNHYHVIVVLGYDITDSQRARLALWMGSDARRACYVWARQQRGFENWSDLLVSRRRYHRRPDRVCQCPPRHKEAEITESCPALQEMLQCDRSADYFPRVGKAKIPKLRIPVGKIPLNVIRHWRRDGR